MRIGLAGPLVALSLALALIGCSRDDANQRAEMYADVAADGRTQAPAPVMEESAMGGAEFDRAMAPASAPTPTPASGPPSDQTEAVEQGPASGAQSEGPAPILYLAYSYQIGMQVPAEAMFAMMDVHVRACQEAGPRLCQLIGSNRSGDPESYVQGYVSLRGEPVWLRGFMTGVSQQTEEAGGRVTSQTTSTEDLTRAIVDTEARLRAMTTLRDRLQALLRSRPGRLSDLLEVERELARVQGEIDSTQSNLAVMRTRVSMSELTLSYESAPRSLRSDTFEPLNQATAGFLGWIVIGFAAIITAVGALLPFALVGGLIVWGALWWRKRRGGRFFNREAKKAPPPPAPE